MAKPPPVGMRGYYILARLPRLDSSRITSLTPPSVAATIPPHSAGRVDGEATHPDRHKAVLPGGFTYTTAPSKALLSNLETLDCG